MQHAVNIHTERPGLPRPASRAIRSVSSHCHTPQRLLWLLTVSRFGPFTAAAALVLLFLAVLAAGPSRKELTPWLPLFIASLSLITVAIYEISRHIGPCPLSVSADDEFSGVSIDTGSERSLRTLSTQQSPQQLLESNRMDPLYFDRHGPPSRSSHRTGTDGTEISLSGVVAQRRSEWDAHTQSYFPNSTFPEQDPAGEPHVRSPRPDGEDSPDLNFDLDSEHGTVESSRPLLGPQ